MPKITYVTQQGLAIVCGPNGFTQLPIDVEQARLMAAVLGVPFTTTED